MMGKGFMHTGTVIAKLHELCKPVSNEPGHETWPGATSFLLLSVCFQLELKSCNMSLVASLKAICKDASFGLHTLLHGVSMV